MQIAVEILDEYSSSVEKLWDSTKITVMVLGPNLKDTKVGSKLRKKIIHSCEKHGTPILGEHKAFIKIHKNLLNDDSDLCSMEVTMALKADAIIIIPDSAGSLVELGMFMFRNTICPNTLVLLDTRFSATKQNFINLGPLKAYKKRKAQIEYVDYTQHKKVLNIVDVFLKTKRALKVDTNLMKAS